MTSTSVPSTETHGVGVGRSFPILGLLLYYAALAAVAAGLISFVPGFRDALIAPIAGAQPVDLTSGTAPPATVGAAPWPGPFGRGVLTLTTMLGAFAVALPVAWALKRTRQLRYDPSLVQTLIVLPIVVSGVVLVVKNSLALAFSLAGIVAGVRFRQKLDEPEEAVYVLLALGIGLAAGVQALDIAIVMSMLFTFVVLSMWRWDIGSIFAGGKGAQLSVGDPALLEPTPTAAHRAATELDRARAEGMEPHGMLVLRASDPEAARRGVEVILGRMANKWQLSDPPPFGTPSNRIEIPLELKDKVDPAQLIAELEARLSDSIVAAEYVPLGNLAAD